MEDELFGHEPGAGADMTKQREGCFELADTGTLFLDEIGVASITFQQRLLRVLQDGRFMRLGGARPIEVDVRIVAATNQNLQQALADGSFRRDLHFRLNAFPVTLPPLRERKEDIAPLSRHFMQWSSGRIGRVVTDISPAALKVLESYNWPGNARELRNVIERAVILCRSETIEVEHLNLHPVVQAEEEFPLNLTLAEIEKRYLLKTFKACEGNVTKTAATLDISANTLRAKLKLYGVKPDAS
jgi:DNA-binding NtrC family response regulator